ncbi:MAG: large conductance mechanosensitive channel protein MscL [Bryobacteraceae bacterium]|nr:large conductance mechanosensitive channel protein MscL [Bryobacteraceae bacterium]MDW8377624.1 large conductance mechanosensitive channel protein MscL [Bryobacterales bacterium]
MLTEFKEFAMRGNVVDMAVGIVLGAAFGSIITSLVNDVMMPPVGLLLGGLDFKDLFINLGSKTYATLAEARKENAPVIAWGAWLNTVINFVIVAFCMFLVVRAMNAAKKAQPTAPAAPSPEETLLTEIRDLLKSRSLGAGA